MTNKPDTLPEGRGGAGAPQADGLSRSASSQQAVSPVPASIPSAQDIEQHLLHHPEDADYVVQMPQRVRIDPEEIWIEGLGAWLRTDGSYASFDYARGGVRYDEQDREILARVVAYWKTSFHAQAMSAGTAETQSGSGRQPASAVAQPCAQPQPQSLLNQEKPK